MEEESERIKNIRKYFEGGDYKWVKENKRYFK